MDSIYAAYRQRGPLLRDICESILQGEYIFSSFQDHVHTVQVSDFPSDYPPFTAEHHDKKPDGSEWAKEDILNHGGTCIVGPLGAFVREPVWDKEEIAYGVLELSDLTEARVRRADLHFRLNTVADNFSRWTLIPWEVTPAQTSCKLLDLVYRILLIPI
jgi:hypothetical protein